MTSRRPPRPPLGGPPGWPAACKLRRASSQPPPSPLGAASVPARETPGLPPEPLNIPHGGLELAGLLHCPAQTPRAGVVIAHGLYSSMRSEKLTRLAQALARAGYLALQFDASGCGESPGQVRRTTLTSRAQEFLAAARALSGLEPGIPLAYLGSSLGGTAALVAAGQVPPLCTVCWSTPVDLGALAVRLAGQAHPPELPDMPGDIPRHHLEALLARSSRVLFIHGELDEVVPVAQAHRAHELAAPPKGLLVLPGADHRLSRLEDQERALARTLAWLECLTPRGRIPA